MKTVPKMSKESEEKILDTLEKIASDPKADNEPNLTIAKYVQENQIPVGHIPVLVNAYNIGKTNSIRQNSDDVWSKSAGFEVANTKSILDLVYPETTKSACEKYIEGIVSDDYKISPTSWVKDLEWEMRKTAIINSFPKAEPYKSNKEENNFFELQGKLQRLQKQAEEARRKVRYSEDVSSTVMNEFIDYFKTAGHLPYNEVKTNCFKIYGQEAAPIFEYVELFVPNVVKQAEYNPIRPASGIPYSLFVECLESKIAYQTLNKDFINKQASYEQLKKNFTKELGVKTEQRNFNHPILDVPLNSKEAGFLDSAMSAAVLPLDRYTAANKAISSAKAEQSASGLTSISNLEMTRLKNLNQKMQDEVKRNEVLKQMLQDPVLSAYDPKKLFEGYSELEQLAKYSSKQPAVMRDFLRRYAEGGSLSYFDLKTLTDIERNLRRIRPTSEEEEY